MTEKGFGMTTITNTQGELLGVFTDGDLRRIIDSETNISSVNMSQVMTENPKTVNHDMLVAEALTIMEKASITAVVVEDARNHPIGVLHMHDILRAGVI
jgi:arabinose-5-phosphate isomerase